jgi:4-hydroxybenzoate polyprenyltransferase
MKAGISVKPQKSFAADTYAAEKPSSLPLIVDLDGTLLRTDFLWETALAYLRAAPWGLFLVLYWLARGRARLKAELARRARIDIAIAPVNEAMVALATAVKQAGSEIVLATAADIKIALAVRQRFPFIDRIMASDGALNLKSEAKLRSLNAAYPHGFIYAGDSRADLPVWSGAAGIIVVNASAATLRAATSIKNPIDVLPRANRWHAAWKLMRPHQWAKNALILVPVILGGMAANLVAMQAALIAFAALSLVASATYAVNDLIDLEDDRRHWSKRNRPLASGTLPIPYGLAMAGGGLALGFAIAAMAGSAVVAGVFAYLIGTLLYSFLLKRIPIVDVTMLAGLFTLRIAIGGFAATVPLSPWLLTFSMFLFVSLSLAKRNTEIVRTAAASGHKQVRGYTTADQPFVLGLGVGSLVAAILVFVLYLTQEAFVAAHLAAPKLLWAFPPILFLITGRIWLVSGRGELHDDPVAFALKDRSSLIASVLLGLVFLAAWRGVPGLPHI